MNKKKILNILTVMGSGITNNYKLDTALAWIKCAQKGKSPIDRLRESGIDEVIVYGVAELGKLFIDEAKQREYKILGITDREICSGGYKYQDIPLLKRNDMKKYGEYTVVITAMTFWKEIRNELMMDGVKNIVTLRELL